MSAKFIFLLICLITGFGFSAKANACREADPFPFNSGNKYCPADVQKFMDRVNGCGYFQGEDAYDEDRKKELNNVMTEMRCDKLSCDYHSLLKKYKNSKLRDIMQEYVATVYFDGSSMNCNKKSGAK